MKHDRIPIASLYSMLLMIALACGLAGCQTPRLAPDGPYAGQAIVYTADNVIVGAYDTLHAFVTWEYENRDALAKYPQIRQAADHVRANAKQWISSAIALRDAYATAPTEEGRAALEQSLRMLRTALVEAARYMAEASAPEVRT